MSTHKTPKTQAMFERAKKVMPWGVSSNFRYWGEDITPVVSRAQGAYLWDTDGNRYMNRPGPTVVESLQILAEILHPDAFQPTLEGIGWQHWKPLVNR